MTNGWSILRKKSKTCDSDELLRVRPECKLNVRLIDQPVKVVRVFSNDKKCIVVDNEHVGQQLRQKYAGKIGNISVRYACWCIDRDTNTMKILDMPKSVAKAFGSRAEIIRREISGIKEGCDWVVGTNGRTGKDVRYNVAYQEETPLTHSEQEMVDDRREDKDGFDLTKVFKSYGFDEAEEKVMGVA